MTQNIYDELRPTNGWDRLAGLGHPSKFQRVSRLGFVTAPSLNGGQLNFARYLAVSCAGILCIHFWGLLPLTEFCQLQSFPLRPSLAFSYIVGVIARHSSSGRQPEFAAFDKEWNYGTFAKGVTYIRQGGHHVGHRPHSSLYCVYVSCIYYIVLGLQNCRFCFATVGCLSTTLAELLFSEWSGTSGAAETVRPLPASQIRWTVNWDSRWLSAGTVTSRYTAMASFSKVSPWQLVQNHYFRHQTLLSSLSCVAYIDNSTASQVWT